MRLGGAVYLPDQNCFGIVTAIQRFGRAFMRFGVKLETGELCMVESARVLPAILPKPLARTSATGPANTRAGAPAETHTGPAIGSGPNSAA